MTLHRTVYYEIWNGVVRFLDWAKVIYNGATYWEPFMVNQVCQVGQGGINDPRNLEDAMCRIDALEMLDSNRLFMAMGDQSCEPFQPLNGGLQLTRTGR
jgi:hypothetical protein